MKINHRSGEAGLRLAVEELVINWHLTEACNYHCQYCYAAWEKPDTKPELHRDQQSVVCLLNELFEFFRPNNAANPLTKKLEWQHLRLSIAGGEPTLLKERLEFVVATARKIGFRVSLITNASLLDQNSITDIAPHLSSLGISLDSNLPHSNSQIGRVDKFGMGKSAREIGDLVKLARTSNPEISIKLNTVINDINAGEEMARMVRMIQPERWKVMRVLPVLSPALAITDQQFQEFVSRHAELSSIMSVEDNNDMVASYIMVDPLGRFFQNGQRLTKYAYSRPIHEVGAEAAFAEIDFHPVGFANRYRTILLEGS